MGSLTRKLTRLPPQLGTLVQHIRAATPRPFPGGMKVWQLPAASPAGFGGIVHKGWSIVMSKSSGPLCALDHEHWHLSCKLVPVGRGSVVEDWHELGRIVAKLQYATGALDPSPNPVVSAEDIDPNAAHHWAWNSDDVDCAALRLDVELTKKTMEGLPPWQQTSSSS
jgi:hypothetical protein